MKERDLQDVKTGDLVASVKTGDFGRKNHWTGAIHEVTNVAAKRYMVNGHWCDKATGREVGHSSAYYHILATPQIQAEWRAKKAAREAEDAKRTTFYARPEQKDVSAIFQLLSDMTPDNHPLDRLSAEEWAALRRKLTGSGASDDWSWQCNECGADEYSSSVSEHDIVKLACGNCGANDFHKVPSLGR